MAGSELMIRVGRATKHNNETRGFHAPRHHRAATARPRPCGQAAAGSTAPMMLNALGIAGSTSAGLLELAHFGTGAMVASGMHLGRAAESGASWRRASPNRASPGRSSALEGQLRLLNALTAASTTVSALTRGLGSEWASPSHHAQALPGAHHLAHLGAGHRGPSPRARLCAAAMSRRSTWPAIRRWRR